MDVFDLFYYLNKPLVLFLLFILLALLLAFFIAKNYFSKVFKFKFVFDKVVLLISVPKNSGDKEE